MTEEVRLKRGRGAHANPERQEIVAEIEPSLDEPGRHVGDTEDHDRLEAIADRLDPEPRKERGAEVGEGEAVARDRHGPGRSRPGRPPPPGEERGHADSKA